MLADFTHTQARPFHVSPLTLLTTFKARQTDTGLDFARSSHNIQAINSARKAQYAPCVSLGGRDEWSLERERGCPRARPRQDQCCHWHAKPWAHRLIWTLQREFERANSLTEMAEEYRRRKSDNERISTESRRRFPRGSEVLSQGGYSVDYTLRDFDGDIISEDSIQKCE